MGGNLLVTPITKYVLEELEKYTNYTWSYSNKKPTEFNQYGICGSILSIKHGKLRYYCASNLNTLLTRGVKLVSNDDFLKEVIE